MSVKTRLEDAKVLYANGHREGALLMVLIAVAATSRKRYPKPMGDRQAFTKFVGEEMETITRGPGGSASIRNFNIEYLGKMMPLQDLLYEVVRCNLAHEGQLPDTIVFEPDMGLRVEVDPDKITFTDGLLDGLCYAVVQAPENSDLFLKVDSPPTV